MKLTDDKKFDIFICFRNEGGAETAKLVYTFLRDRKYSVFISDVDLSSGHFDDRLYEIIKGARDFVLICSKGALDKCSEERDWVRNEIAYAIKCNSNIVPILSPDFKMPRSDELPHDMSKLPSYNGIPLSINMFDQSMNKLTGYLQSKPKKNSAVVVGLIVLFLLLAGFVFYSIRSNDSKKDLRTTNVPVQQSGNVSNSNGNSKTNSKMPDTTVESSVPFDIVSKFTPGGWMGDGESGTNYIEFEGDFPENTRSDNSCIRISYTKGPKGWAGIYWLYPDNNCGDKPGYNLEGKKYSKITFWARCDQNGKRSEFKAGGIKGKEYEDSFDYEPKLDVKFQNEWKKYELDLRGQSLQNVIGGFCWVTNKEVTFYLDDIQFE